MALTLQDQIAYLLQRDTVADKTGGTPSVELQAAAVIETVALNFYLQPRTALYFFHLARNALLSILADTLTAVDTVSADVRDLGNASYAIRDTTSLERARVSLMQVQEQGRLNTGTGSFKNFDSSVSEFLSKQLAKNVRRPGATELVRPSSEAASVLPGDFAYLKSLYAEVLDRFYALLVGIGNFSDSLSNSLLGLTAASRVQEDITAILQELEADPSGASSRDFVTRLLAARQALKLVGTAPDVKSPRASTAGQLPFGYDLMARTAPCQTVFTSSPGPFTLSAGASASALVGRLTGTSAFPISGADVSGLALLVGEVVSWPVTVPANTHLFLSVDDVEHRVHINDTDTPVSKSLADIIAAVNATTFATAYVFAPNQLAIAAAGELRILSSANEDPVFFLSSAAELFGFSPADSALPGVFQTGLVVAALNNLFGYISLTASVNEDGSFSATAPASDLPVFDLTVSGVTLTLAPPTTNVVELFVPENGVGPTPVVAADLADPGDTFYVNGYVGVVVSTEEATLTLDSALPPYSGPFTIRSALVAMWLELQSHLETYLVSFLNTGFTSNLDSIDRAIAPLYGSPTQARQNNALQVLDRLKTVLLSLEDLLAAPDLPVGSAIGEAGIANSIIQTLIERRYDRALDFLLHCRIKEVFELDWQTLSFGGELMAAVSDFAQRDIRWPDRTRDEGNDPHAVEDLGQ